MSTVLAIQTMARAILRAHGGSGGQPQLVDVQARLREDERLVRRAEGGRQCVDQHLLLIARNFTAVASFHVQAEADGLGTAAACNH